MRGWTGLVLAAVLVIHAGCARVRTERAELPSGYDCAGQTRQGLRVRDGDVDARIGTETLQCMLVALREEGSSTARSNLLGSRICLLLATRETDTVRRERWAAEGVRFAETALAAGDENQGAAHYWLASNLGLAVRDHLTLAIQNMPRLEREMKQALALSPDIDHGGPLRLLGMLYLKAPPWPAGIGDGDQALELLEKAALKYPEHPLNHLFYAQALWAVEEDGGRAAKQWTMGMKRLREGDWGNNRGPWMREFAAVQREFDPSGASTSSHSDRE